ncbi:MAG: 2-amino-4-hydroxy-6-hydroxymethyldihydropteridine diphosphokinase [Spirochaetes bacterium]|nr:2-amino-4-hydroxy-6-hydroxymethyldihydropteridine diphosphokinase [Spirochaetota bacterium]
MTEIWLGLGSNLGNREAAIRRATDLMPPFLSDIQLSGLWESKARYVEDQPDFLNAVVRGLTELGPELLLEAIQAIENEMGRDRVTVVPKGPRIIDIDILLYGEKIIVSDRLVVPHPGMRERKFVLLPLLQLDPSLVDPVSRRRFSSFLAELPPQGIYPCESTGYHIPYP